MNYDLGVHEDIGAYSTGIAGVALTFLEAVATVDEFIGHKGLRAARVRYFQPSSSKWITGSFKELESNAYQARYEEASAVITQEDIDRFVEAPPTLPSADSTIPVDAYDDTVNAHPRPRRQRNLSPAAIALVPSLAAPLIRPTPPVRNHQPPPLGTTTRAERAFPAFEQLVLAGGHLVTPESREAELKAAKDRDRFFTTTFFRRPTSIVIGGLDNAVVLRNQNPPSAKQYRQAGERNKIEIVSSFPVDAQNGHIAGVATGAYKGAPGEWSDQVENAPFPPSAAHSARVLMVLLRWMAYSASGSAWSDTDAQARLATIATNPLDPTTIGAFRQAFRRIAAGRAPIIVLHQATNRELFIEHELFPEWIVELDGREDYSWEEAYECGEGMQARRLTEQDKVDYLREYTIELGGRMHFAMNCIFVHKWKGTHDIMLPMVPHLTNADSRRRTPLKYDAAIWTLESGYVAIEQFCSPQAPSTIKALQEYENFLAGDRGSSKLHAAFDPVDGTDASYLLFGHDYLDQAINLRAHEQRTGVAVPLSPYPELRQHLVEHLKTDFNEFRPQQLTVTSPPSNIGNYLSLLSNSTLVRLAEFETIDITRPGVIRCYARQLAILQSARSSHRWRTKLEQLGVPYADIEGPTRSKSDTTSIVKQGLPGRRRRGSSGSSQECSIGNGSA